MNYTGKVQLQQKHHQRKKARVIMSLFRWSIPLGAQRVMDAVKEGHKSSLSSGKMVALAAGLSVGATVGYFVYRHISSTNSSRYHKFNNELHFCILLC